MADSDPNDNDHDHGDDQKTAYRFAHRVSR